MLKDEKAFHSESYMQHGTIHARARID